MINDALNWLGELLADVIGWIKDALLWVFEMLLNGIAAVIGAIPVPDFLQHGIASVAASIPSDIQYFLFMSGINDGILIISAGVAFRLTRKLVTLGQW